MSDYSTEAATKQRLEELRDIKSLKGLTDEDWQNPRILSNIRAIVEAAASGSVTTPVDADAPPKSLADLKGKPVDYINQHWGVISKLLEAAGREREAARRAKLAAQKAAA